ncbi:MAG: hypothetical protein HPY52_01435 [Firmicutes bacterium]|nr:hypothetical protein [Bacillota bacterium]
MISKGTQLARYVFSGGGNMFLIDEETIRCEVSKGALSDGLISKLRKYKPELLEILRHPGLRLLQWLILEGYELKSDGKTLAITGPVTPKIRAAIEESLPVLIWILSPGGDDSDGS